MVASRPWVTRASLVTQWMTVHLEMQGTQIQAVV